ncbi:MAG: SMI1/KNR4 family protein [Oscillospiraceae bacterium]|nr:SMI1/KNR4 family protein [Oscillospiraceae bacterium]
MHELFSFLHHTIYEVLDAPLTSEEVSKFERLNNISLPEEYKYFLTTIGNGIRLHLHSFLDEVEERTIYGIPRPVSAQYNRRLALEFPFDEPYHEHLDTHDFDYPEDCIDPDGDSCEGCHHFDHCFHVYPETLDTFDHMIYNGTTPILYAGCAYTYFLILSGKHRGEIWINNELEDFAPAKPSFSAFLHWVVTEQLV